MRNAIIVIYKFESITLEDFAIEYLGGTIAYILIA